MVYQLFSVQFPGWFGALHVRKRDIAPQPDRRPKHSLDLEIARRLGSAKNPSHGLNIHPREAQTEEECAAFIKERVFERGAYCEAG